MSSRRNHAARSRKTYRMRQYAAARNLRGSLPFEVRKALYQMRFGKKPDIPEELADAIDEATTPKDEVAA